MEGRAGGGVLACRAWIISCVATRSSTWERVTGEGAEGSRSHHSSLSSGTSGTCGGGRGCGEGRECNSGREGPGAGRGAEGVAALRLLRTRRFFSGVKKEGPDPESPAPSLPVRTSRRNTNITRFPFATGQRGGKRVRALRTSDVWKRGSKSTQVTFPWLSFWADRTLEMRWSLLRNH